VKNIQHYRLFVALGVPEFVIENMVALLHDLRRRLPGKEIRWAHPDNSHLTLAFLGDVPVDKVEELTRVLTAAAANISPIQLHAGRIGFFPHARSPKVIWVWVHDDQGELIRLQRAVASACVPFGAKDEGREFTGHLTLGRIERLPKAKIELLGELAREMEGRALGVWTTSKVNLMRSELSAGGSQYTCLSRISLSKT
jgi:2'-5' RNA ligase